MTQYRGISILCTGDIHLGRHPTRVETGEREFSPTTVWRRIVDTAIRREVDAVALTGDVVDRNNRYFEARGPLQRGIEKLGGAGIPTFAVAGNHDFDVLPQLVDDIGHDQFHLVGVGGRWDSRVLERPGGRCVRFVGWSYPTRHVHSCPVDELNVSADNTVTVGLLHTELDKPDSPYAPVRSARLAGCGVDVWLLGHIHRPHRPDTDAELAVYPGSPQPLDPRERGLHGPWLVDIDSGGAASCRQLPMATLRYRRLTIELHDIDDESAFRRETTERLERDFDRIASARGNVQRVIYRLELTGRTPLHRDIERLGGQLAEQLRLHSEGIEAHIDRVVARTEPPVDLHRLSSGNDPPAVLARLLLKLRDGSDDKIPSGCEKLFATIRERIARVHRSNAYAPISSDSLPDEQWMRRRVVDEGMTLLDEMLQQS